MKRVLLSVVVLVMVFTASVAQAEKKAKLGPCVRDCVQKYNPSLPDSGADDYVTDGFSADWCVEYCVEEANQGSCYPAQDNCCNKDYQLTDPDCRVFSVPVTLTFGSDTSWGVFDADPAVELANPYGRAQFVCLNPSNPVICSPAATYYGWVGSYAWTADIFLLPNAYWIWVPCVTGGTPNASLKQYFFSKAFLVPGIPTAAMISIAVDDYAEVHVNGQFVGSHGSTTVIGEASYAQSNLAAFDITEYLDVGVNIITVYAKNGPDSYSAVSCTDCTYKENSAGVVFGGSITYE